MSNRIKRNLLLPLLFLLVAALMAQCTPKQAASEHPNGLTCSSYSSSIMGGLEVQKGADCRFKCPDGRLLSLPEAVSSQSKDELNFLFCGVPLPPSTPSAVAQGPATPIAIPSIVPPLNKGVTSCDLTKHILTFTFIQPMPDLKGKTVGIEIQGQPAQCSILPKYPGILSCKIAPSISLPAGIVVKVNDQTVDAFAFSGDGCYWGQTPRVPHTATPASTQPPTPKPTKPAPTSIPPTLPPPPTPVPTEPPPTSAPTEPPPTAAPTDPPATSAPTDSPPTAEPTQQGFFWWPNVFLSLFSQ